jgi:hypothetical protein
MQPSSILLFYLGLMIKSPTSGSLFSTSPEAQTNETVLFDLIFLSWFSFILDYTDQQDY